LECGRDHHQSIAIHHRDSKEQSGDQVEERIVERELVGWVRRGLSGGIGEERSVAKEQQKYSEGNAVPTGHKRCEAAGQDVDITHPKPYDSGEMKADSL
jgi:hypothetical protein